MTDAYRTKAVIYLKGRNASGLKIGDRVRVTKVYNLKDGPWGNTWTDNMTDHVGKEFTIIDDNGYDGFELNDQGDDYGYDYPFYVLEKV